MLERVYQPDFITARPSGITMYQNGEPQATPPETGERAMMRAFMEEKMADAKGRKVNRKNSETTWCFKCHYDDLECGCYTMLADGIKVMKGRPDLGQLFTGGRLRTFRADQISRFEDGHLYYRVLRPKCPNAHTIQACAKQWLASKDCDDFCFEWDFDATAYRRAAGVGRSVLRSRHRSHVDLVVPA